MTPAKLEGLLRELVDPTASIHDMTDNGGFGLVRWSRPFNPVVGGSIVIVEHIVHRWAVVDTLGQPLDPAIFYSGGYYEVEEFARADYRSRIDPAPTYAGWD